MPEGLIPGPLFQQVIPLIYTTISGYQLFDLGFDLDQFNQIQAKLCSDEDFQNKLGLNPAQNLKCFLWTLLE